MLNIRKATILTGDLPHNFDAKVDGVFQWTDTTGCAVVFASSLMCLERTNELSDEIKKAFDDNPNCYELQLYPR